MSMHPLNPDQIASELQTLHGWTGEQKGLNRKLEFDEFRGAMQFMYACIDEIDRLNHHPVWTNKYNCVDIHLDTFDAGNVVTELDIKLAQVINRILSTRGREFGLVESD